MALLYRFARFAPHTTLGVAHLPRCLQCCDTQGFPAAEPPMDDNDTQVIKDWLKEHRISEVECLVPDMTGNARGKFIPAQQFLGQGEPKLPESIMIQTVTGEYSDDHWDFVEPTDADMFLRPDVSTLRLVPWAREPTAQIIHDCYKPNGELHPLSSRSVLRISSTSTPRRV